MKKVSQVIPKEQVAIIKEALSLLKDRLKNLNPNGSDTEMNHKLFDVLTLTAMLNKTEMVVNLPFDVYEKFTSLNGIDFPEYINN